MKHRRTSGTALSPEAPVLRYQYSGFPDTRSWPWKILQLQGSFADREFPHSKPSIYFLLIPSRRSEILQFQSAVRLARVMVQSLPSFAVPSCKPGELEHLWKKWSTSTLNYVVGGQRGISLRGAAKSIKQCYGVCASCFPFILYVNMIILDILNKRFFIAVLTL